MLIDIVFYFQYYPYLYYVYMDYKDKYIKYKTKYLKLRNVQIAGNNNRLIIHISGPSGAGKTTLGNKLKDKFADKIIVKDTDELRDEFIKAYYGNKQWKIIDKEAYQKYIDEYVNNNQNKPLVFVGLNNIPWFHKNHYYNMHSKYNYYIEIDDMTIVKQKCMRFLEQIATDEIAINDLINDNKRFLKFTKMAIERECGLKETMRMNKKWSKDYKKQGYKFMSRENIFGDVSKIIT